MISLIGSLISISSLFWLTLLLFKMRSRENISWLIKDGVICRICREDIIREIDDSHQLDVWVITKPTTCTACKRDQTLSEVLGQKIFNPLSFVASDNWRFVFFTMSILSVFLQSINLFLKNGYFGLVGGLLLFFAQMGNYYNFMKISRPKKPNH